MRTETRGEGHGKKGAWHDVSISYEERGMAPRLPQSPQEETRRLGCGLPASTPLRGHQCLWFSAPRYVHLVKAALANEHRSASRVENCTS